MFRDAHNTLSIFLVSLFALSVTGSVAQDNGTAPKGSVYKQVDPEGNVTYTDKPPSADAKPVTVPKGTEYAPPKLPEFTPAPSRSKDTSKPFSYDSFAITAPKNDESIWDNTGNINASVSFEPFLQSGHDIEFLLDGVSAARGSSASHQFSNVDRGTHEIVARIVDSNDQVLESATVTFHMKRHHK